MIALVNKIIAVLSVVTLAIFSATTFAQNAAVVPQSLREKLSQAIVVASQNQLEIEKAKEERDRRAIEMEERKKQRQLA